MPWINKQCLALLMGILSETPLGKENLIVQLDMNLSLTQQSNFFGFDSRDNLGRLQNDICTMLFMAALWPANERLNNPTLRSRFHLASLQFVAFQTSPDVPAQALAIFG